MIHTEAGPSGPLNPTPRTDDSSVMEIMQNLHAFRVVGMSYLLPTEAYQAFLTAVKAMRDMKNPGTLTAERYGFSWDRIKETLRKGEVSAVITDASSEKVVSGIEVTHALSYDDVEFATFTYDIRPLAEKVSIKTGFADPAIWIHTGNPTDEALAFWRNQEGMAFPNRLREIKGAAFPTSVPRDKVLKYVRRALSDKDLSMVDLRLGWALVRKDGAFIPVKANQEGAIGVWEAGEVR